MIQEQLKQYLDLAVHAYQARDPFVAEAIFRRAIPLADDLLAAVAVAECVASCWDLEDRYFLASGRLLMELAMARALDLCRNSEDARWLQARCRALRVPRAAAAAFGRAPTLPLDPTLRELQDRVATLAR